VNPNRIQVKLDEGNKNIKVHESQPVENVGRASLVNEHIMNLPISYNNNDDNWVI